LIKPPIGSPRIGEFDRASAGRMPKAPAAKRDVPLYARFGEASLGSFSQMH
jgi:hypothetical protein